MNAGPAAEKERIIVSLIMLGFMMVGFRLSTIARLVTGCAVRVRIGNVLIVLSFVFLFFS